MLLFHLAATCDILEPPPFGVYECSDSNLMGSVCTFRCEIGYQVIGETERTCQNNSHWSPGEGSCGGKDVAKEISNLYFRSEV